MSLDSLLKHKMLSICGIISLVLIAVGLFMMFKFKGQFAEVDTRLKAEQSSLTRMFKRKPYPTEENIKIIKQNKDALDTFLNQKLIPELSENQIKPMEMERNRFNQLLENTKRSLDALAESNNVEIVENYAYGFEKYTLGVLPNQSDVPRLTVQLQTIRDVSEILFRSGIQTMVKLNRDLFEIEEAKAAAPPPSSRRRRGGSSKKKDTTPTIAPVKAEDLYSSEKMTLQFSCPDRSIWQVLNKLASSELFIIVRSVELLNAYKPSIESLEKERNQGRDSSGGGGLFDSPFSKSPKKSASKKDQPKTHEERVVAGRENVTVTMDLEIYRFKQPEGQDGEDDPSDEEEGEDSGASLPPFTHQKMRSASVLSRTLEQAS